MDSTPFKDTSIQRDPAPSSSLRHKRDLLTVLNKNPKYRYHWVIFDRMRQNGGIHHNGWRLLTSLSKAEEEIIKEYGFEGTVFIDGCIRRYEMALAFMPIEEWKQLKASKEADARAPMEKIRRTTKDLEIHEYQSNRGPLPAWR